MGAIKERGETDFGEVGEGVVLYFTNSELKRLQAELGGDFLQRMTATMVGGEITIEDLEKFARVGAKRDRKPIEIEDATFDKITIKDLAGKVLDALYGSFHGETFESFIKRTAKALKERADRGEPDPSPSRPDMTS